MTGKWVEKIYIFWVNEDTEGGEGDGEKVRKKMDRWIEKAIYTYIFMWKIS